MTTDTIKTLIDGMGQETRELMEKCFWEGVKKGAEIGMGDVLTAM